MDGRKESRHKRFFLIAKKDVCEALEIDFEFNL